MRILLASCFYTHNYGSQLQAKASEYILKKFSDDVYTVNCKNPKIFISNKLEYYLGRLSSNYAIANQIGIFKRRLYSKFNVKFNNCLKIREQSFNNYIKASYSLTSEVVTKKQFYDLTKDFDIIVVGSDMLWNPINVRQEYFSLTYACDEIKKVSMATSIGTSVISNKDEDRYKKFLKRFSCISVREQSAVDLINKILGEDKAQLILDPTLILTELEWNSILGINKFENSKSGYIFAYFLGGNSKHREIVKKFAKEHNLKLISIIHVDGYQKSDINFGDEVLWKCSPKDFVEHIINAEYVFTDSFHCCAFSIIYKKQFFVFNRFGGNGRDRNNTRIDNLLNILNLESCRIYDEIDQFDVINYEDKHEILKKYIDDAYVFLNRSLTND